MGDFFRNFFKAENLHWQILVALVLAGIVAFIATDETSIFGVPLTDIFGFFGSLFVNALKMIVVPLILAAVVVGVANMAGGEAFGRIGAKTVGFYVLTGFVAIFTGLLLVNIFQPGNMNAEDAQELIASIEVSDQQTELENTISDVQKQTGVDSTVGLVEIIKRAIPPNILVAASNERNLLAIIFFGAVFGFFMSRLTGDSRETLNNVWNGIYDVMINITMWIMRFAPIGVFALVSKVLIISGPEILGALGWFFLTVFLALVIHFFVWLPLLLWFVGGINPVSYYGKIVKAQLTAFSTASSAATLPVTLKSATDAGVSNRVKSFVLPLGATVNMDGTALYECVVVIFIAQIYAATTGADFGIGQQLTVVLLALLTSIGVAGIPSASLVAIAIILPAVGLPAEWLAIILVVDRVLDMCRTSTNVTSDLCITAMVASTEGEELPEIRKAGSEESAEAA